MIDISAVLIKLYPDLAGWEVVDNKITKWPDGVEKPTQAEIEKAWEEIQQERKRNEIEIARKERYEKETDDLLYEALAKINAPELAEWKRARETIKVELPYPKW